MTEQEYKDNLAKFQKQLADQEAAYNTLKASIEDGKIKDTQNQIDNLKKVTEAKDQEISVLKASLETQVSEKKEASKIIDDLNVQKKEIADKLGKIEADKKTSDRLQLAKSKLGLSDEDAVKFLESTDKLVDEAFNSLVELNSKLVASKVAPEQKVVETVVVEKKALETTEKTQADATLALATASVNDKNQKLCELFAKTFTDSGFHKTVEKPKFQRV